MVKHLKFLPLLAFLVSATTTNAVQIRNELTDDEILEVEKYIERDLATKGAYKVDCYLEMTDEGYNIVVVNMADPDSIKTVFDPTVVAWYLAHYTKRTDWHSDTLKIWVKPYKEGWGILTKDTRFATAKSEYWYGIAYVPTLREEMEKKLFKLEPVSSYSQKKSWILMWISIALILVLIGILVLVKKIRFTLLEFVKSIIGGRRMKSSEGLKESEVKENDVFKKFKIPKLRWIIFGIVCAAIIISVLLFFALREDTHIKKGRELIASGKLETAAKEFRISLQENPKNFKAKGLLYYSTSKAKTQYSKFTDFIKSVYYCSELERYEKVDEDKIGKLKMEIRNTLYDQGIETESWEETKKLAQISVEMAYLHEEIKETRWGQKFKMFGAAIMGKQGNNWAIKYLCKRLKDDEEVALDCLFMVGMSAIEYLKKESKNKESLIRNEAIRAIPQLAILNAAKEFTAKASSAKGVGESDVAKKIYKKYFAKEKLVILPKAGYAYRFKDFEAKFRQPIYLLIPDNRDTLGTTNLLYNIGINTDSEDKKFFISIWEWKEGRWNRMRINFEGDVKTDLFYSSVPIVLMKDTKEGYDILTADVKKRTAYKREYDYSVYPPRAKRISYEIESIVTESINLVWHENELVIESSEQEDDMEEL